MDVPRWRVQRLASRKRPVEAGTSAPSRRHDDHSVRSKHIASVSIIPIGRSEEPNDIAARSHRPLNDVVLVVIPPLQNPTTACHTANNSSRKHQSIIIIINIIVIIITMHNPLSLLLLLLQCAARPNRRRIYSSDTRAIIPPRRFPQTIRCTYSDYDPGILVDFRSQQPRPTPVHIE